MLRLVYIPSKSWWIVPKAYLERHPGLDLLLEDFSDAAIEVRENLHCQLWLDSALGDELVKGVHKGASDTAQVSLAIYVNCDSRRLHTCYGGKAHRKERSG